MEKKQQIQFGKFTHILVKCNECGTETKIQKDRFPHVSKCGVCSKEYDYSDKSKQHIKKAIDSLIGVNFEHPVFEFFLIEEKEEEASFDD